MTHIPQLSPGCFGSALAYQSDNTVCMSCPFAQDCAPLHEENLQILRERLGVDAKRGPKVKIVKAPDPTADPSALALPRKTRQLVEWLDASKLNVVENMRTGVNPFDGKTRGFLRAAAHVLMNVNKPVPRPALAAAFMKKFNWTEETAAAHVRMTYQALAHIGAIEETEAGAVLRRG